ncbi:hypothetical protein PVAG01_04171 [Phlyctema vagabunda]|uniref:Uncharacterized protein n=1 Tax=Phlyctema vagabunda TaxID=108571 RepID=A0ABR4PNI5_9HELO
MNDKISSGKIRGAAKKKQNSNKIKRHGRASPRRSAERFIETRPRVLLGTLWRQDKYPGMKVYFYVVTETFPGTDTTWLVFTPRKFGYTLHQREETCTGALSYINSQDLDPRWRSSFDDLKEGSVKMSLEKRSEILKEYYLAQAELPEDLWVRSGGPRHLKKRLDSAQNTATIDDDDALLEEWVVGRSKFTEELLLQVLRKLVSLLKVEIPPTYQEMRLAETSHGYAANSPYLSRPWREYMQKSGLELQYLPYFSCVPASELEKYWRVHGKGKISTRSEDIVQSSQDIPSASPELASSEREIATVQ